MTGRRDRPADQERPTVVREVERKVSVPAELVLPTMIGSVPGIVARRPLPPAELVAAYHDTDDHRLARSGASLRRRQGGPDAGWHLKLPAPGGAPGRDEIRLPLEAGEVGMIPAELSGIVLPLVREAPLRHLATVRTARTGWELLDADGEVLAELVDDVVSLEPATRSFRQIEVEARVEDERAEEVLDGVVAVLVAAGGSRTRETKAAAALGVVAVDGPLVVPAVPDREDPAALLVRHTLATGVRALLLAELDVRREAPDAIHRMRVAARTLRSSLRTFAPLLDPDWAAGLRAELQQTATSLGAARDLEVQLTRLLAAARMLPPADQELATAAVREVLGAREEAALRGAAAALDEAGHVGVLVDLVGAATDPRLGPPADGSIVDTVPDLVRTTMRSLRRAVDALAMDGPPEQWHHTRVLAKRARYAADAAEPVLPRARRAAARLARLTDLLGQVQDAVVGRALLAELAAQAESATAFSLGLLAAREEEEERATRAAVLASWPRIEPVTRRPVR